MAIGDEHKFSVPLRVNKNKKSINYFYLNLNNFIQVSKNYILRNNLKQKYSELVRPLLSHLKRIDNQVYIQYTIYGKDAREFDIGNVGAVVDKFLCDVLVKEDVLEDDNYKFLPVVMYRWGGIDRENPRADVLIKEIEYVPVNER